MLANVKVLLSASNCPGAQVESMREVQGTLSVGVGVGAGRGVAVGIGVGDGRGVGVSVGASTGDRVEAKGGAAVGISVAAAGGLSGLQELASSNKSSKTVINGCAFIVSLCWALLRSSSLRPAFRPQPSR